MSSKRVAIFRNIGVGLIFLFGIVSCEKDLEDIAVDLAGQRPFDVGDSIFEVITYHRNVDSSRVDNNASDKEPIYLLGVNRDNNFGALNSDFIGQVLLPVFGSNFGDNAVIDRVVVDIPYFSTRDGDQKAVDPVTGLPILDEEGDTIITPNFTLDSIYGNKDAAYKISIFELGTFLNSLDPDDPTQAKTYYSDKDYVLNSELHVGDFTPNRNDTVLYVERRFLDGDPSTVDDIDTITKENSSPSMKFDLDKQFFQERFIDHDNPSDFDNNGNFVRYFRGLYINAEGFEGSLMNINGSNASMTIYYTYDRTVTEGADDDLNGNGITGEADVIVKTKIQQVYGFGGVLTGKYDRSYGGSKIEEFLLNPDTENGESELYVQGAAGSEIIIDLMSEETLDYLRQQNLLINEANLVFYLDGEQDEVPNRLFLYKDDYNSMVNDYYNFRFGPDIFGGELEYDDAGEPEKYKFRITDYISSVVKGNEPKALSKLVLKNFVPTDNLGEVAFDSIISDWSYIPKGAVLHGNRPQNNEKRIKLEIFYSK